MGMALKRTTPRSNHAGRFDEVAVSGRSTSPVAEGRRRAWLKENADALAAQSEWHAANGHPLADIMVGAGTESWKR